MKPFQHDLVTLNCFMQIWVYGKCAGVYPIQLANSLLEGIQKQTERKNVKNEEQNNNYML